MLFRILTGGLGVLQLLNGLGMVIAPGHWFMMAPGVAETGPFNSHFVIDVGLGFLAAGVAFIACSWRPQLRLAALGASGFVTFHALFHLSNLMTGHMAHAGIDIFIAVLAFLGLALVWPRKGEVL